MTSDHILNRILQKIEGDYDKSEGGFLYDVVKGVSLELSSSYEKQENILNDGFAITASGESLDKKVAEQGIERKPSNKATTTVIFSGEIGAIIPKGTKVSTDVVNFTTLEEKAIGEDKTVEIPVECEIAGTIGNVKAGRIKYIPVTITGVNSVNNLNDVENGYDEESDEDLRQRYLQKVRTPGTSGNKYHYINWAKEVSGVKEAQVESPNPGEVSVTIIDSNMRGTGSEIENLTFNVKNYIDEKRPIGATVQVNLAAEKIVDINVKIVINSGLDSVESIQSNIFKNIEKYIKEVAYYEGYVSKSKIGSAILDTYGVVNYSNLIIPNVNEDEMIVIESKTVTVLGGITYDQVKEQPA